MHGQEAETHCKVDHAKYKIKDHPLRCAGETKSRTQVIGNGDVMVKHPSEKGTGMKISVQRSKFVMNDTLDARGSSTMMR